MDKKDFCGNMISRLAFGSAFLPDDIDEASEMCRYALDNGIDLFEADPRIAPALAEVPRGSYYLLSGCSVYDHPSDEALTDFIEDELRQYGTDHFDYYIVRDINDANAEAYLKPDDPLLNYIAGKVREGRIRHLGLQLTGRAAFQDNFIRTTGLPVDFCAVQMNYLDWFLQGAQMKSILLKLSGMPVMAVKPMRGGLLTRNAYWIEEDPGEITDPAEYCLRWIISGGNADVILSDASDIQQLKENINTCSRDAALTPEDSYRAFFYANRIRNSDNNAVCIGCGHCLSACPESLAIAQLMYIYEEQQLDRDPAILRIYESIPEEQRESSCIGCGQCMEHCSGAVDIPVRMRELGRIIKDIKCQ